MSLLLLWLSSIDAFGIVREKNRDDNDDDGDEVGIVQDDHVIYKYEDDEYEKSPNGILESLWSLLESKLLLEYQGEKYEE